MPLNETIFTSGSEDSPGLTASTGVGIYLGIKMVEINEKWSQTALFSTLPRTTRGTPIVISGDPKGENFLYTNGNSVVIRNIANPAISEMYTEHSSSVIVAKYSPSRFYIASGDISGKVRIWDTVNKEHLLKNEFPLLGGTIKDLDWSFDSQKLIAVGEGRERFAKVINADTGTTVGDIMGQSKSLNTVAMRQKRPFRIATGSEDGTIAFYKGPPFKFEKTTSDHNARFVQCLRYSPDGSNFISGGADGKSFIYDGAEGEKIGELGSPAHKGGIYGLCYNGDGKKILTVSADKTAKIWDVETTSVEQEFVLGKDLLDMQVGCLWQGDYILTVSLSGFINYLDRNNPDKPIRVIRGHNKPITALTLTEERDRAFTASSDGLICRWDLNSGESEKVEGKGHSNQVMDMCTSDDVLVTCSMDDSIIFSSVSGNQYGNSVKMPSQPRALTRTNDGLTLVACVNQVVMVRDERVVFSLDVDFEPNCISVHPGKTEVAVGGDKKLMIYTLSNDTLTESRLIDFHRNDTVTDVKYSPDGAYLSSADSNRKVFLFKLPEYEPSTTVGHTTHNARVKSISWAPDSNHFITGALDTHIIQWNPLKMNTTTIIKRAHPMNQINKVCFRDNQRAVSVSQDCCLKQWAFPE